MTRLSRRNIKLELADAEITRCHWCGSWTTLSDLCAHCQDNPYPTIDDLGETA